MSANVYLVGAGPGAAGLITVRGQRLLERADAVVYDRLVAPRLLNFARADAISLYVGKTPERASLSQIEINRILVERARTGQMVVRLKGGDPFVFGRGGEEGMFLSDEGIDWEAVPGVTSAIAVLASAGIPVTHRQLATSFTVVTGREALTESSAGIDYGGLARKSGTLVIMMGVAEWPHIARCLQTAGIAPDMPAAVVQAGTTAKQKTVTGTLATLAGLACEAGIEPPAVIVLGEVVRLQTELSWHERRPLAGRRLLIMAVTAEEARHHADAFEEMGAEAFDLSWEVLAQAHPAFVSAENGCVSDVPAQYAHPGLHALIRLWNPESIDAIVVTAEAAELPWMNGLPKPWSVELQTRPLVR
ncbi:MAG: uroporphyrinogen-III C-methyltransferase, partial [Bacilli bacterium]